MLGRGVSKCKGPGAGGRPGWEKERVTARGAQEPAGSRIMEDPDSHHKGDLKGWGTLRGFMA